MAEAISEFHEPKSPLPLPYEAGPRVVQLDACVKAVRGLVKGEEAEPTLTWRSSDAHLPRSPPTARQRGRFSHREEEEQEADRARLVPSAAGSPF